ncbi:hypothetical protein [Cellulosilyticum ruminicola]|nr:hypothetical protein [Cellulosilyticum ruminicola]
MDKEIEKGLRMYRYLMYRELKKLLKHHEQKAALLDFYKVRH